jgi:hypothetical protein
MKEKIFSKKLMNKKTEKQAELLTSKGKMVIFFFLMLFSANFGVSNALANPGECTAAGGVCSTSNNCINVAGSTGVQISTVWCDMGTTQTSACCTATPVPCLNPAVPDVPPGCVVGPEVPDPSSENAISFASPLQFTTVEGILGSILNTLQGIIVLISLVFIVIGAVMYITSAGNDKQITAAKNAITAAMIGLAIGIAAPSFLKEIAKILGWGTTGNAEVDAALTLAQIATNVLNFLLAIVGVLGIIMLVLGGSMYLTSAGDDKKIDTAKAITKWAIIGIAIALGSLVIVRQIAGFFA